MAYPPEYERAFSFTDYEVNFPGEPKPGDKLDTEYDAVSNALTATQTNLALIQRADGALANDSVGEDQLQDGLLDGIVDGVTADAEAAAAAAAASASAAAGSAAAADASATDVAAQVAIAAGHAASAGVSQGIAQAASIDAADAAALADTSADVAVTAATSVENSVAQAQLHEEKAFQWAEYLAAPVMPAPPGWPEAVDDGMFSAKWWALRARDYNEVHEYDFGTAGANPGEAFDIWDLTNDLEDPPGLVYMTWGTPPRTYVLTDPSDPSDPNSWMDITGADGPPGPVGPIGPAGPPNTLTIGTVTTGLPGTPADATITGTAPNQVLNMTIPAGADGAGTTLVAASGTIGLAAVAGVATTAARSDSTPPLSQAIAPTWTGEHRFQGAVTRGGTTSNIAVGLFSGLPMLSLTHSAAGTDKKGLEIYNNGGGLRIATINEAASDARAILAAIPGTTGPAVGSLEFGNATDNPAYNFLGTGLTTHNGPVNLLGTLQATGIDGVAGQVLSSQGAGLPPVWRTSSGGSIELGYNFAVAVGTANPGSQKLSLNSAVYASVTVAVFNALAMTNFDANTILSLLNTGNRIYIQQRNDASKAVVYEVTGPGTNMTGYWTIPVVIIQSRGTLFSANADLNVVFILSVSSSSFSNPTASVGLTAVNGSATTGMRSDAAPALSQAIAPTWTGQHVFTPPLGYVYINAVNASLRLNSPGAPVDKRMWDMVVLDATGQMVFRHLNDGPTNSVNWLAVTPGASGAAITDITFGNAGDNPTFTFQGSGLMTWRSQTIQHQTATASHYLEIVAGTNVNPGYIEWFNGATRLGYIGYWDSVSRLLITGDAYGWEFSGIPPTIGGKYIVTLSTSGAGGQLLLGDGTVSNPTHSFAEHPGSGMWWNHAGNSLAFSSNGVESFTLTSASASINVPANISGTLNINAIGASNSGIYANAPGTNYAELGCQLTATEGLYIVANYSGAARAGIPNGAVGITNVVGSPFVFGSAGTERMRITPAGSLQITGGYSGGTGASLAPGIEISTAAAGTYGLILSYNRGTSAYLPLEIQSGYFNITSGATADFRLAGRRAITDSNDGYLRLNNNSDYTSGIYTPLEIRTNTWIVAEFGLRDNANSYVLRLNHGAFTYGSVYASGMRNGFAGYAIDAGGSLAPNFMSNGTNFGIHSEGDGKWMIMRDSSTTASMGYNMTAPSFTAGSFVSTSSRAIKRETGKPSFARDILARLRPLLYRLLDGDDREQLGLIAEEVRDVCPQLSDGKSVAYDRLAILLLAAWQDEHLEAA